MKRSIFVTALIAIMFMVGKTQAQIGFQAGYAPQTLTVTTSGTDFVATHFQGYFAGINYTYNIFGNMAFTAAAQIRLNSANTKCAVYNTLDWQFIADVPLLLSYAYPVNQDFKVGAFAGPLVSYGITYRQKQTDPETFEVLTTNDLYTTKLQALGRKRLEMNAMAGLVFQYKSFMLFGGYRLGLNDLDKMANVTTKVKGFFVGIGMN